jgi:HEAT repeat protein
MKKKAFSILILAGIFSCAIPAWAADSDSKEDALYSQGTRAINDGRWPEAEGIFTTLEGQHGSRAEAALYWKAYAQNKEGKQAEALATCAQLRQTFPHGKWIDECGALEIEIRSKGHDPLPPQKEQDEELKLLALNSLMQQDEAKALPILRQILTGDKSEKLKTRALFVLAQDPSPQAQQIVGEAARNERDPNLQRDAVKMLAIARGKQAADTLADIYRHSSNEQVREAVLHGYLILGTPDPLLEAATHEADPQLARTAVHSLGAMGATSQLLALYRSTASPQTKAEIINGLVASGPNGLEALRSILSSEQDPELRSRAIRNLGAVGGMATAPSLLELYKKNPDPRTRKSVVTALFIAGDSHDLIELARSEKDPELKKQIVQQLSIMHSKEATDYMLEILNK